MLHSAEWAPQGLTWQPTVQPFYFLLFSFSVLSFPSMPMSFPYLPCSVLFTLFLFQPIFFPFRFDYLRIVRPRQTALLTLVWDSLSTWNLQCRGAAGVFISSTKGRTVRRTFFTSCPLTHHPHSSKRGVILCRKSLGSLNHTPDTLLAFLITVVALHLIQLRGLMTQDTATRLTFCYGRHDWNVTVWGGQEVNGWAGDAHFPWTHGDKPHWGSSLSLFMEPPVAAG